MENISLSLPRRSFSSNTPFTSHKSVYDDVFGGPPKLGLPTLAPRCEDYSEIFGGFHTSQSSSIPVLHLPLIASDDSNLHIDVDYTEVFGGCGGFDYAASLQDLVGHLSGGYDSDSSGEPWSPAQSGSLSDELYPVAGPDKSQSLSNGDSLQSLENIDKQNASYSKSCHMGAETVLTASSHVSNVSAIPGYTFSLYESPVYWDGEDEHHFMDVTDNINHSRECGARLTREKQYKCLSNSSQGTYDTHRNDYRPAEKHVNSTSLADKPFVTVSDISLRTKPSQLPPPSRPPPVLVHKRRERDKQNSELKPCQRYATDRVADDISPLFFDMEIDGTKYAEGRANGIAKASHQGTKEPAERKYFHSPSAGEVDEKTNETVREASDIEDENFLQSHGGKTTFSVRVVEERIESIKSTERTSGALGVDCCKNGADNPSEAVSWREATGYFEVQAEAKCHENEVEAKLKQKDSPKRMNIEKMNVGSQKLKQTSEKHEQTVPMEEFQRIFEEVKGAETRKIVQERMEAEGTEMLSGHVYGKHSRNRPEGTYELKENVVILNDAKEYNRSSNKSYIAAVDEKGVDIRFDCDKNMEAGKMIGNECQASASGKALEQAINDIDHKLVHEMDLIEKINQDVSENDNEFLRFRMAETQVDNVEEAFETTGNMKLSIDTCSQEELIKHAEEIGPIGRNGHDAKELEWDLDNLILIDGDELKVLEEGYEVDEVTRTKVSEKHVDIQTLKYNKKEFSSSENGDLRNKPMGGSADESQTATVDTVVLGRFHEFGNNKDDPQDKYFHGATKNSVKSPHVPKQMSDSQVCGSGMGAENVMSGKISSALAYSHGEGLMMSSTQFVKRANINEAWDPHQMITESNISQGKMEGVPSCLKHNDGGLSSRKETRSQQTERKDSIMKSYLAEKDQRVGERIRRETVPENERMRKIEEEREREREREKDRMAVDKAALEARERSYFEVRERADRAAVERATTDITQRALAEAQERLEKASKEARIRADRAAVERATAEARQRAAEKLMAQKATYDSLDPVERPVHDRFSASSRSTDTRQSFLSSDIHFQGTGVSNRLRHPYSSAHDGAESESPQRCKARLERYRRTAERAANALAEKNRRDLLAQREREERTRVAEALDAEVKRWSSGKEGNLRALLSTLQYILGPDSGWHPVSLTEIITSAAVKKAYRRATLCVHPDKLQQRGATIQQKYICEKVFDLLKEAWNKFNSEER